MVRFSQPLAFLSVLSVLGLGSAGCNTGGGGDGGSDVSQLVTQALQDCGLLSEGVLPTFGSEVDDYTACMAQCYADASCADLEMTYCQTGDFGQGLSMECMTQCAAHGHTCGDGTSVPPAWVCDGAPDCEDASDEPDDCPGPFTCDNGTNEIPAGWVCDGEFDCEDQSDEAGCPVPPSFTCGDGSTVPAYYQCDQEEDCIDGSDELDCAMFLCP